MLISTVAIAAALDLRVETTEIFGTFQSQNQLTTYKFKDGAITCYGQVIKRNGLAVSESLSCIK